MKMARDSDFPLITSLIAGGIAGLTVDLTLFPLETLKTRLQSPYGFFKCGGFHHLYKGIGIAAIGSVPSASVFFCTYDTIKTMFSKHADPQFLPLLHMIAASAGEIGASFVKVPIELVKQRQQATLEKSSAFKIYRTTIGSEGYFGLYRGFTITVLREIPFGVIQLPIWEWLKKEWKYFTKEELSVVEVSVCGSVAGGIAAAATTPLDVAKTRIMLDDKRFHPGNKTTKYRTTSTLIKIYKEQGVRGLFAGFVPRVILIAVGGAVFFGAYQAAVDLCTNFYILREDSFKRYQPKDN